jgi:hypothetical protein
MSYPIYKLLRAVNRQYPNNGFINYVDVREDMYNHELIDEDLRDLINETIQEVYKDVAIDEVWSFPTVPGQNQYVLPEDCDLRDIQEVTRTFVGCRGPLRPPFGPVPGPIPPGPDPQHDKTVVFSINPLQGTMTSEHGTQTSAGTIEYYIEDGGYLTEIPTVTVASGYIFLGWSLDGTTIVTEEELLNTPITGDTTITGIFEEEGDDDDMRTIVTAYMSEEYVEIEDRTEVTVPLTTNGVIGAGFTFENNKVTIGAGIEYVKVSATCSLSTMVEDVNFKHLTVELNGSDAGASASATAQHSLSVSDYVFHVLEGDEISLAFTGVQGDVLHVAYLTVEEVKAPTTTSGQNSNNGGYGDNPLNG